MAVPLPSPLDRGFLLLPRADLDAADDSLDRIVAGDLLGVVVQGVYDDDALHRIIGRLDAGEGLPPAIPFAPFKDDPAPPYERGLALVSASDSLDRYLADVVQQRAFLRRLFAGLPPLEPTIDDLLSRLGGGRPTRLAPGPRPQTTYTPATLRVLTEGYGIDLHVGLSFLPLPCCRHLCSVIDATMQLSWFLTLQVAEEGGELVTYGLSWDRSRPDAKGPGSLVAEGQVVVTGEPAARLRRLPALAVRPAPGDVLVFDGGHWYHEVGAPRRGTRRTIGGFLAFSTNGEHILRWA